PARLNAWTGKMESELREALLDSEHDDKVGAIVITGAGKAYCAGADMGALNRVADGTTSAVQAVSGEVAGTIETRADFRQRFSWIAGLSKPVIGAINGACVGMGFTTALYHDIRIASERGIVQRARTRAKRAAAERGGGAADGPGKPGRRARAIDADGAGDGGGDRNQLLAAGSRSCQAAYLPSSVDRPGRRAGGGERVNRRDDAFGGFQGGYPGLPGKTCAPLRGALGVERASWRAHESFDSRLLVERMLEAAVGMTHGQYRTSGLLHHAFGHAAQQDVRKPGAAVRSEHDQVGGLGLRGVDYLEERSTDAQQAARL